MTTTNHIQHPEIPLDAGQVQGWKEIPINDIGVSDPLIPLGPLSRDAAIFTTSIYFGEHNNSPYAKEENELEGSLLTLFVRQSVARRLLMAERLLPPGYHLLVFDTYRPYQVQKSLYDFYKQKLKEKHPNMNDTALDTETQKYVSLPSTDPSRPSPHNTGGAVDAAIIKFEPDREEEIAQLRSQIDQSNLDFEKRVGLETRLSAAMKHGTMLEFGTAFDHGGEKSALAYYESKIAAGESLTGDDKQARDNRRLLFKVMTQAGFQPYFAEWWHFNAPESQMGAAAAGREIATFGAATLSKANEAHENIRRQIRQEILEIQEKTRTILQNEILTALHETSDSPAGGNWPTEIIAPQ